MAQDIRRDKGFVGVEWVAVAVEEGFVQKCLFLLVFRHLQVVLESEHFFGLGNFGSMAQARPAWLG